MKTLLVSIATTFGLIVACAAHAQAPASAPAGTTGQCKDGSWYSGASKKGACHGHQGVKEWYGAADAATPAPKSTPAKTATTSAPPATTSKGHTSSASSTATASTSAPASAPAGSTGLCNDGTYYSGESKRGACHGHKGVKDWYGASATAPTATSATAAKSMSTSPAATSMPATMPAAATPKPAPTTMPTTQTPTSGAMSSSSRSMSPAGASPAPGGGAGKVWVNPTSKVYHCSGDRYYGTTKEGGYMSEADAIAKGNRAAHGKACSS